MLNDDVLADLVDVDIDPIYLRPDKPETFSIRSFLGQLLTTSCSAVPKSEMATGGDVSGHQGSMTWNQYFDNGMQFTIIRAMINGYPDNEFDKNANTLTVQNRLFGVYGATGYPTLSNAIPYARKLASLVDGVGNLCVWWDVEAKGLLDPYGMAKYTSEVMGELGVLLPEAYLEIYTRQSFWDSSVAAGNWSKYPLAAARYNTSLTCPWSDGLYKFRDWDDWLYWQDSQWYDGKKYGAQSTNLDHLYFNGTLDMLKQHYAIMVPPTPQDCCEDHENRISALEEQIKNLSLQAYELKTKIDTHEHESPDEEPNDDKYLYVTVKANEKVPLGIVVGHDKACDSEQVPGKPIVEHPAVGERIIYMAGDKIKVYKYALYSCKDNPLTPTIIASGGGLYYLAVDGYKDKDVSLVDASRVS